MATIDKLMPNVTKWIANQEKGFFAETPFHLIINGRVLRKNSLEIVPFLNFTTNSLFSVYNFNASNYYKQLNFCTSYKAASIGGNVTDVSGDNGYPIAYFNTMNFFSGVELKGYYRIPESKTTVFYLRPSRKYYVSNDSRFFQLFAFFEDSGILEYKRFVYDGEETYYNAIPIGFLVNKDYSRAYLLMFNAHDNKYYFVVNRVDNALGYDRELIKYQIDKHGFCVVDWDNNLEILDFIYYISDNARLALYDFQNSKVIASVQLKDSNDNAVLQQPCGFSCGIKYYEDDLIKKYAVVLRRNTDNTVIRYDVIYDKINKTATAVNTNDAIGVFDDVKNVLRVFRFLKINDDYYILLKSVKKDYKHSAVGSGVDKNGKHYLGAVLYKRIGQNLVKVDEASFPFTLTDMLVDGNWFIALGVENTCVGFVDTTNDKIVVSDFLNTPYELIAQDEYGRLWGLSSSMNIELFGRSMPYRVVIKFDYDKTAAPPVDGNLVISVYDVNGNRVSVDIGLTVLTPDTIKFKDGSYEKIVTTSDSEDTLVPITVTGYGYHVIHPVIRKF